MNNFTVYEGRQAVAQVNTPPNVAVAVRPRAARKHALHLPPCPLRIPPRGFVVLPESEAKIFGLKR